jgi:hypothetical protein
VTRIVYDLGETLLIVACDRIAAYDHVPAAGGARQGQGAKPALNFGSRGWRPPRVGGRLCPNHLLATDPADFPAELRPALATSSPAAR